MEYFSSFRKSCGGILAAVLFVAYSSVALAEEPGSPQWQFNVTPYLWIAGITGTLSAPNNRIPDQSASATFGDILSHLNSIPIMGAAEARYGRFGIIADIMAISVKTDVSTRDVLFSGGSTQATQVIGTALGTYRVAGGSSQSLDLGLGVRAFGLSTDFTVNPGLLPGLTKSPGATWAYPITAIRYQREFGAKWGITGYADIGGGPNSEFTWQLMGTVDYRLTASTIFRLGYRHLLFQYNGEGIHQNMGMGGPIIGATFCF
jgi:hypothetical protein